jgi:hypothetical protein
VSPDHIGDGSVSATLGLVRYWGDDEGAQLLPVRMARDTADGIGTEPIKVVWRKWMT